MAARTRRKAKNAGETKERQDASGEAPARGIWSGSISFGLLQIPVSLFPAESRAEEVHFRQLDRRDLAPIRYERVSSSSGKKVAWDDIVKGYEIAKDEYVVLEPEELAKANVKATQTLDIQDFVPRDAIEATFYETPYYLAPGPRAEKAYVLLRDALAKKEAAAIATFVLRTREHLVAIVAEGEALLACVLRFGHELRRPEDLPLPAGEAKPTAREAAMAEELVDRMMTEWDPGKYRDRWFQDVKKLLQEKAKHGVVKEHHARSQGTEATDVVDLLALLKQSVAKGKPANDSKKKTRRGRRERAA